MLRSLLSPLRIDSRLRMCVAGKEKGRESRDVTRCKRSRRFLQDRGAVLWPSTSVDGRERLRLSLLGNSGDATRAAAAVVFKGNVRMGSAVGCIWVKTHGEGVGCGVWSIVGRTSGKAVLTDVECSSCCSLSTRSEGRAVLLLLPSAPGPANRSENAFEMSAAPSPQPYRLDRTSW